MAKDYFQDVVPSDEPRREAAPSRASREDGPDKGIPPAPSDRGIRNINIPSRSRPAMGDMRPPVVAPPRPPVAQGPHRRGGRVWLWILSGISVLAVVVLLIMFVFRSTSVTIVPQSQPVTFDASAQFAAYPADSATSGTIPYTVQSTDIEDSEVVQASGTQHVDTKASGSITIVNNFSNSPLHFVANTRFETSGGLIFKAPAAITIPAKSAAGAGKVNITVIADQAGQQYNVGPQNKFTIPGLKSSPTEYTNVYAYSTASTTGGFSGDQPGVAPSDMDTAVSKIRGRLQDKATAFENAQNTSTNTALGLHVTFTDTPLTPEASGSVRIHESAHVDVAVVPSEAFASAVAQTVAADASAGPVMLVPGSGFAITPKDGASWGTDPIDFTLSGQAHIVWQVDTTALAKALAGRDSRAFETIVSNFPGVESAHARIEPFWESKFPADPAAIHISIQGSKAAQ